MDQYRRDDLTFDVIDRGPADGPTVVLLHGFPQFNTSWDQVIDRLVAQGYRCVAPNQRGYSPGARPPRRRDYRQSCLAKDVLALIDTLGGGPVHLVGHDLGGAVAWGVAARAPERLASLTVLGTPHPRAFLKAMATSRQGLASWYMYAFQLPRLPERMLARHGRFGLARVLENRSGQARQAAERDVRTLIETGSRTGALNWYRAMPLTNLRTAGGTITVPTQLIWSDGDIFCLEKGARDSGKYVTGEYRFEVLRNVSHWIQDERPDTAADLLLDWMAGHPIAVAAP